MGRFLIQRLLISVVLILGSATLVFLLLHAVPGDPVRVFLGDFATPAQIAAVRHALGLDQPVGVQYLAWLANLARGNLGTSLALNLPVTSLVLDRLPRTLELAFVSVVLAILIGMPTGLLAALNRGKIWDLLLSLSSLVWLSVPIYVSGTVFVLVFAVQWRWLPASGYVSFASDPIRHLRLLALPCFTLALYLAASIARMTRSSILEVINHDYVQTARAKGLVEAVVIQRHVLRNALIPVITIIGLQAGNLLGGAVIVETIFAWPGLSTLLFQSIQTHDYPVVQGCVLAISALFILFNLIVDLVNGAVDPRIAHGRAA